MSLTSPLRVLLAGVAVTAVLAVGVAFGVKDPPPADGRGRIVLISGRDDHGLLASPRVSILSEPEGARAVGTVGDGTLARVVGSRGEWLQVRSAEGPPVRGWVNDYYLRGLVRLVGPAGACRVRVGTRDHPAGAPARIEKVRGGRVFIRVAGDAGWLPRNHVAELAPPHVQGCGSLPGPTTPAS